MERLSANNFISKIFEWSSVCNSTILSLTSVEYCVFRINTFYIMGILAVCNLKSNVWRTLKLLKLSQPLIYFLKLLNIHNIEN